MNSDGRNVARQGKATQSSTANGGAASKAIDGNKSGKYGDGGQTHTEENSTNPWWEVDLGVEVPIDSIVVWNRTDDRNSKTDRKRCNPRPPAIRLQAAAYQQICDRSFSRTRPRCADSWTR